MNLTTRDLGTLRYFLYPRNERKVSRSTTTIALCAIMFFIGEALMRQWTALEFVRPPREKRLPVILSPEEVHRILAADVLQRFPVCLMVLYSCDMRLSEGLNLQVPEIDSARELIDTRHGKGCRDQYVRLPQPTLLPLRGFWKTHHNPGLLLGRTIRAHEPDRSPKSRGAALPSSG